jgi:hypothetical protein
MRILGFTNKYRDIQQQRRFLLYMMLRDAEGILYIFTIILFNWFTMGIAIFQHHGNHLNGSHTICFPWKTMGFEWC